MNKNIKNDGPILVTGSHRSGSSWVGEMLSLSNNVRYIHEPFTPFQNDYKSPIDKWFVDANLLSEEEEKKYQEYFKNLLYKRSFGFKKYLSELHGRQSLKRLGIFIKKSYFFNSIPLIKDPIGIFSAEWLEKKIATRNIILIRHPAAFVASTLNKKWNFDSSEFLKQPKLLDGVLSPFKNQIISNQTRKLSLLEQNIMGWNIIFYRILKYEESHPEWYFIKYEDIATNPIIEFKKIYDFLKLEYTKSVIKKISDFTLNAHSKNSLKMNSAENIKKWKNTLSKKDILKIKTETFDIWKQFYKDSDW